MDLGKNIKIIRTAKSISQKQLAYELGVTPAYLSMLENNVKKPSFDLLEKLGHALETPLSILFSDISLNIKN